MEILLLLLGIGVVASFMGGGGADAGVAPPDAAEDPDASVEGGADADVLTGTEFSDVIFGRGGNDTISGLAGEDLLDGNAGADSISGGFGDDTLFGGVGNDTLDGGVGQDFLRGGDNADLMFGGAGNDSLEGAIGPDTLSGGDGADTLRGGPGTDSLGGDGGADSLEGGPGNDTLSGILGDFLAVPGSDGDVGDILEGWDGADLIIMGTGDQAYGEFATTGADNAADTFVSGIWVGDPPPVVHDYTAGRDSLVLYYDPVASPTPEVEVTLVDIAGEQTYLVALDGKVLMEVRAASGDPLLVPEDIALRTAGELP